MDWNLSILGLGTPARSVLALQSVPPPDPDDQQNLDGQHRDEGPQLRGKLDRDRVGEVRSRRGGRGGAFPLVEEVVGAGLAGGLAGGSGGGRGSRGCGLLLAEEATLSRGGRRGRLALVFLGRHG